MNRTTVSRTLAFGLVLGALLGLALLMQLGATRASFDRVGTQSYVDLNRVCQNQVEFGLALADDGDDQNPVYQAYISGTPSISVTVIATATLDSQATRVLSDVVALPRIDEPPLVISYTAGVTPATYLYAHTDLTADDPQYVTGTLPGSGNLVLSWSQELVSGTEVILSIASTEPISPLFPSFAYPPTGSLTVELCTEKTYLPLIMGYVQHAPNKPSNPSPADGSIDQAVTLDLEWTGGDPDSDPVTYDVYLDADNPAPATLLCGTITTTTCAAEFLDYSSLYNWQVVAKDTFDQVTRGPVWSFRTAAPVSLPPYEPSNPTPYDGADNQAPALTLSWQGGDPEDDEVRYRVLLDAEMDIPETIICDGVLGEFCPVGPLSNTTDYAWQVIAEDEHGAYTRGEVWEFTTGGTGWVTILEEDFEGFFPNPVKWSVGDNNGIEGGYYDWDKRRCRPHDGKYSGWAVGGGDDGDNLNCGDDYPNDAAPWMVHGPFSLEDASDAQLLYAAWLNADSDWDSICHYASINGKNFEGSCSTLAVPQQQWIDRGLDLTDVEKLGDVTGEERVWIVIAFESDDEGTKPEGAYVDNIVLRKYQSNSPTSASSQSVIPNITNDRPASMTIEGLDR